MTVLNFLGVAQDYLAKRKLLLERIKKALGSCKRREECVIKVFKILSDFLEKDPTENVRVALSVASSLPAEYGASIIKFIEAFNSNETLPGLPGQRDHGPDDVSKMLTGNISCSDLDNVVYMASESKDFVAIALTLAVLERASELRGCERDLARSLIALVRRLYERGNKDLVASILNKYSVRIYVHKSGEEIRGAKIAVGNDISVDLTEIMSLIYSDLSTIINSGNTRSYS